MFRIFKRKTKTKKRKRKKHKKNHTKKTPAAANIGFVVVGSVPLTGGA
jgi:hypothetical protein